MIRLAPTSRVTANQWQLVVREYGRHLIPLPPQAFKLIDCVPVIDSNSRQWSVVVSLFTQEEGHSDLTLELCLRESHSGYEAEIDDLLVF